MQFQPHLNYPNRILWKWGADLVQFQCNSALSACSSAFNVNSNSISTYIPVRFQCGFRNFFKCHFQNSWNKKKCWRGRLSGRKCNNMWRAALTKERRSARHPFVKVTSPTGLSFANLTPNLQLFTYSEKRTLLRFFTATSWCMICLFRNVLLVLNLFLINSNFNFTLLRLFSVRVLST